MVFECKDSRTFLKRTLAERVARNPSYSMRSLAKQLEMAPSMLSAVLAGKRNLSVSNSYKIGARLGLTDSQIEYLSTLVQLESVKSIERRSALQAKLRILNPSLGSHDLAVDRFKMISAWYHLPILEMCELAGAELTAKYAARRLGIPVVEAELALERLERLELLTRDEKGCYAKVHENLLARSGAPDEGLRIYHRQMLQKAVESIDTQTPDEKFIGTFNVALDPAQLKEAKAVLREAFQKIASLAAKGRRRTEIYHLSSAFFNLTHEVKGRGPV